MTHKHNPIAAVSAVSLAQRSLGLVTTLLASMPHEHERAAGNWQAEWTPMRELLITTDAAAVWLGDSLEHLVVRPEAMAGNIRGAGSVDVGDAPDLVDAILDSRRDGGHCMSTVALHRAFDGPVDGPAVALIHAIGTSTDMWAPQVPVLSRDFRVLSIDLRGHGRSPVPSGPYAMGELADDVIAVLDSEGIEHASVCGLSLGGMVALTIAASAPGRVDRLIAACVVSVPPVPAAWHDRAQAVLAGGSTAVSDLVVERWGYRDRAPEIGLLVRQMLAATPAAGYAGCCEAIAGMDLRPILPTVAAPTLLLVGSDDPAAPETVATEMAVSMPDAHVAVIEGAAHLMNVEAPSATTDAILEHLRR